MRPSGIEVAGTLYHIADGQDAYAVVHESAMVKRRVEAGGELGEREVTRPDLLVWRWGDWSAGEGQKNIDTRRNPERSFARYFKSGGAVNIRKKGEISLGLALSQDLDITGVDVGPHLVTAGRPVVAYSTTASGEKWNRRQAGTWGTAAATGNGAAIRGQIEALNNKVFIGSRTDIVRVDAASAPAAGTTWETDSADGCLVADTRLYFLDRVAGENVQLDYVDVQPSASAPFTPTNLATIGGWDTGEGLAADGNKIYALLGVDNERLGIFTITGTKTDTFREYARLPDGFRIPSGTRRQMIVLNGVVFVGGFFDDPHGNESHPVLVWVTDNSQGAVGRLRERGNDEQVRTLFTTIDDEVLFGTSKGKVYAYNMSSGGVYEFASGGTTTDDSVQSFCYDSGQFFVATLNNQGTNQGQVFATLTSGAGKYPASVKVEGSKWDFDVYNEDKILLRAVVNGNFPTNTSADLSFELDDGSEITTDSAGATMSANTTGDTVFTLSDADTERVCRWAKPNITLKTSDTSVTPTIYDVIIEATTAGKKKFIEVQIDLDAKTRTPTRAVTGAKAGDELETLADGTDYLFTVKPFYEKSHKPHPRSSDSYVCVWDQGRRVYNSHGKAVYAVRFRVV